MARLAPAARRPGRPGCRGGEGASGLTWMTSSEPCPGCGGGVGADGFAGAVLAGSGTVTGCGGAAGRPVAVLSTGSRSGLRRGGASLAVRTGLAGSTPAGMVLGGTGDGLGRGCRGLGLGRIHSLDRSDFGHGGHGRRLRIAIVVAPGLATTAGAAAEDFAAAGPETVGPDTVGPDTVGPDTVGPDTVVLTRAYRPQPKCRRRLPTTLREASTWASTV